MLEKVFLGMSLLGAEWVLYLLILLSVVSVTIIIERARFYSQAAREIESFRRTVRESVRLGKWDLALQAARERSAADRPRDLESELASNMIAVRGVKKSPDVLAEVAHDTIVRNRLDWERNLAVLATIGNNAPFIGLFGTVLGIIKAFHDLSQQAGAGAQTVTAGISEALIATAVGIMVAIPAVVAFNLFQRKVRAALNHAESMKSFLIGELAE